MAIRSDDDVKAVQALLSAQGVDAWLLYDFRGANEVAADVVRPAGHLTRRWFYLVPREGDPVAVVHRIETPNFDALPGRRVRYASWKELHGALRDLVAGRGRVAMEYSAMAELPYLSRVDAGTLELLRSLGAEVVSSAELVQAFKSRWSAEGKAGHLRAFSHLRRLVGECWTEIGRRLRGAGAIDEHEAQRLLADGIRRAGLIADADPIVAVNANAANPHYAPGPDRHSPIRAGDLVLIDIWAREPDGIYADVTYMAFCGARVPDEQARVFEAVRGARDAAVELVRARKRAGEPVRGCEVDTAARAVIDAAGYGEFFTHRTGHSIDTQVHGSGVHMDDYETHDTRLLVPDIGFSIEPGIYLEGRFGVRSEIDVWCGERDCEVTTAPVQTEIERIL